MIVTFEEENKEYYLDIALSKEDLEGLLDWNIQEIEFEFENLPKNKMNILVRRLLKYEML